jgi:hypothetical protein
MRIFLALMNSKRRCHSVRLMLRNWNSWGGVGGFGGLGVRGDQTPNEMKLKRGQPRDKTEVK